MKDITGQKFTRLTVLRFYEKRGNFPFYECLCDCGKIKVVRGYDLLNGRTKSCGCWNYDRICKSTGEANFNKLFGRYRRSARISKRAFELTKQEFKSITSRNCYYCGKPPYQVVGDCNENGIYWHNGIDRINNLEGYVLNNCVPCCEQCNRAKRKYTKQEFLNWVFRVYKYSIESKENDN